MRDPKRIDRMLSLISKIWHRFPDMRLGQLLSNFAMFTADPYFYEDDIIETRLLESIERMEAREKE